MNRVLGALIGLGFGLSIFVTLAQQSVALGVVIGLGVATSMFLVVASVSSKRKR